MTDDKRDLERLAHVRTYSIHDRAHKVNVRQFAVAAERRTSAPLIDLFPRILAGESIRAVVASFAAAKRTERARLFALGGHVVKCGGGALVIDLMRRGLLTGLAVNGAVAIHDLELAMIGETSEDVAATLPSGAFGMVEETPARLHAALRAHGASEVGFGAALARELETGDYPFREHSILAACHRYGVPVTVHVALGTDTVHMHPSCNPALVGQATYRDFQTLTLLLRGLHDGGTYWNIGSAVVLPEIFLKALALCRNVGWEVERFTTVNLDMAPSHRARENVGARATGQSYSLTGHHELMLPLLHALLLEALGPGGSDAI